MYEVHAVFYHGCLLSNGAVATPCVEIAAAGLGMYVE